MGTNYYAIIESPKCACCGRQDVERLHIGKSSVGWTFALHVYPEKGINDLEDWREELLPNCLIEDEYGRRIEPEDMLKRIIERQGRPFDERDWSTLSSVFVAFDNEADFHRRNHSERGPNNLLRRRIDGNHCIGHGAGTWDLLIGEFF